jgi:hypothetical protein
MTGNTMLVDDDIEEHYWVLADLLRHDRRAKVARYPSVA